jgi:hypothetical protein
MSPMPSREEKRLKSLARDHFRNSRKLALRLVLAEMELAKMKKEIQS